MSHDLSATSLARLHGVHPDLVRVVKRAATLSSCEIAVTYGVRTHEEQVKLYAQGRTAPGKIVTWTMASKHIPQADGWGHAVDLAPVINGVIPWNDLAAFEALQPIMFKAAELEGVKLVWGADWNHNGVPHEKGETDNPHYQLAA